MVFVKYDYIPVGSMDKLVLVFYTAVFWLVPQQILKRAENYYRSCAVGIVICLVDILLVIMLRPCLKRPASPQNQHESLSPRATPVCYGGLEGQNQHPRESPSSSPSS